MPILHNSQVFDWNDPDTGQIWSFSIGLIELDLIAKAVPYELVISPMDPIFCRDWIDQRGVDIDYAIKRATEDKDWLTKPVITFLQLDGHGLMVDGQHRFAANYMLGKTEMLHILIKHPHWLKYRHDSGYWRKR